MNGLSTVGYVLAAGAVVGFIYICLMWGSAFFKALPWAFKDIFTRIKNLRSGADPVFNIYGVHIFCGRVGCGKTISMVRRAEQIKQQFPKVKILANFTTDIADGYITCWQDILTAENIDDDGVNQGVLFLFDEIHLTFSSQNWKNAPDNLLEYISLQRHLHKCIFGASQVWTRVNKVIKEQTDFVIECQSFMGARLIKNSCFTNEDYQINGTQKDSGQRKRPTVWKESFVATDKLRSKYDTDEIISGLSMTAESQTEKLEKRISQMLRESTR